MAFLLGIAKQNTRSKLQPRYATIKRNRPFCRISLQVIFQGSDKNYFRNVEILLASLFRLVKKSSVKKGPSFN